MSMNPPVAAPKKTPWLLYGAGAAVVLGLIAFVSSKSSSGGTTAAGTSINAALGSLQEEQLNTQGQVGLLQQSLGLNPNETLTGHIDANDAATWGQLGGISDQINALGTASAAQNSGVMAGIAGLGTQIAGVGGQVSNVSGQVTNLQGSVTGIQGDVTSLTGAVAGVSNQVNSLSQQDGGTAAAQNSVLNQLLNWVNEIKARLQEGAFSAPEYGPSGQPWTSASSPELPMLSLSTDPTQLATGTHIQSAVTGTF